MQVSSDEYDRKRTFVTAGKVAHKAHYRDQASSMTARIAASSAETIAKVRDEEIRLTIDGKTVIMSALEAALRRTVNVTF